MTLDAELVHGYYVYQYTFLDDLQFVQRPHDVYRYKDPNYVTAMIAAVAERFTQAGWEGDGNIGVLWLPPFVDVGIEDTWGTYVWHVKQTNDGISFLACDRPLVFDRLAEQNRDIPLQDGLPINIIGTSVNCFLRDLHALTKQLDESIQAIRSLPESEARESSIDHLLTHFQGLLVRTYVEFLDDCYLRFLIDVINNGNRSKLTIQKTNVKVDPNRYVPDDAPDDPVQDNDSQWLTVQGLISDIWKSFKFEPYKKKVQMLFGSVQFTLDDISKEQFLKHVILRNCVQHHEGLLDKDSLRQCGLEQLSLINEDGRTYQLKAWDGIWFTRAELSNFASLLEKFAMDLSTFIDIRIPTRHYLVERSPQVES